MFGGITWWSSWGVFVLEGGKLLGVGDSNETV